MATTRKKSAEKGKKVKPSTKLSKGVKTKPKVKSEVKQKTKAKVTATKKRVAAPSRPATKKSPESTRGKISNDNLRIQTLRRQLITRREEIVKEAKTEIAKYIKGETSHLVETALDDGDWSVIDLSADINLRLLETHRGSLLKIDEALRKLKEGSFGKCEDCGGEISAERLKVMPFAIYCRDCQEKREEIEKVEKEEIVP